jgi:hypothetical protein
MNLLQTLPAKMGGPGFAMSLESWILEVLSFFIP